jgi:hypothetical protein
MMLLLGFLMGVGYCVALASLVLWLWLSRKEPGQPPESKSVQEARKIIEEAWR